MASTHPAPSTAFPVRAGPRYMLASLETTRSYSMPLLGGDPGTEQTINAIRSIVDESWKNPEVVNRAARIVIEAGVPQFDSLGQVRAIYDWVARNFYFIPDPVSKENLRTPPELLRLADLGLGSGDCDDINAILLPSLLGAVGFETRLVTIAANPSSPEEFSHVYAEVLVDGQWIPVDAARQGAEFGLAPGNSFRARVWSLTDTGYQDQPALGLGRYVNGMGDWAEIAAAISQGAAGVFRTVDAPGAVVIGPGGYPISVDARVAQGAGAVSFWSTPNMGTYLLIGGAVLLLVMMRR